MLRDWGGGFNDYLLIKIKVMIYSIVVLSECNNI